MEKICEFCTASRPVVYCKADAAYLCLSCDAKVHSANQLSNRHLRTLLCDSCKYHPAYAQCLDHKLFMCHGCDQSMHADSSQHQKRVVSSYIGCPSAKDFAALWGFQLGELDKSAVESQLCSTSSAAQQLNVAKLEITKDSAKQIRGFSRNSRVSCSNVIFGPDCDVGSSNQQLQIITEGQQQQETSLFLQQIIDLKRLQLTEENDSSAVVRGQVCSGMSSPIFNAVRKNDDGADNLELSGELDTELQQSDCLLKDLKVEALPLPFSQPDHLSLPSTTANPLFESFWQCKSPVQNSQLWSQNMQDLRVCEEVVCLDDFNIPDVDLTFHNFEELFGSNDHPIRELLVDKNLSGSSVDKAISSDKSDNGKQAREDLYADSSVQITASADKYKDHSNQVYNFTQSLDSYRPLRPCYSAMSFSFSRLSAGSGGTEYLDSGLSPLTSGETSCQPAEPNAGWHSDANAKENAMMRYKEKKKARLLEKQVRYAPKKARRDVRKRVRGQPVKTEGYESNIIGVTRKY